MFTADMDALLKSVSSKIEKIVSLATPEAIKFVEECLRKENKLLEQKVTSLKEAILEKELKLGILQYKVPRMSTTQTVADHPTKANKAPPVHNTVPEKPAEIKTAPVVSTTNTATKQPKTKPPESGSKPKGKAPPSEGPVDVGRLDMRVGRIVEVMLHPDADSLYVEKVDLGEGKLRTVVSGLVKFVPLEKMQNRVGIFMCNLKPAKMRGVESEAMLMCASAPEAGGVEPLEVITDNIQLGEAVVVPGYDYNPDQQLNPKKKIFEQVKPDLRVSDTGLAAYKGVPWKLKNSPNALIKAPSLMDVQIA